MVQQRLSPALKAVSDAVLAVASKRSVEEVLQRLVDSARELADARYAALGIPDGEGGFRRFLVSGMGDQLIAAMGPLPRTHGMLGAMLEAAAPYRTGDIHDDPRFRGWWPRRHPDMRSFLGVPIVSGDDIIGAFYLTEKQGAATFDADDEAVIELLASHAAIAITNARLYERSRELSIISERNRLALELHDVVSQKLFSVMLTAEAAAAQLDRDPDAARRQLERLSELARESLDELRSLILGLRPPELERDGLEGALRKELEMLGHVHGIEIELEVDGPASAGGPNGDGEREFAILRIAHEALNNAVRHARADHITVRLSQRPDVVTVEVRDDGVGFDPRRAEVRSRHLGLTSMEERARELGGTWRSARRLAPAPPSYCGWRAMADAIRILLVDDHAVVREGLRNFLALQDGLEIVGEASDGAEAIEQAQRLEPDVILMDLVMPGLDGIGAMRQLRVRSPASRVIVLTSFLEDERVLPAIQAGAAGYLLKNVAPAELARAIRAAHAGEAIIDPTAAARLMHAIADDARPRIEQPERLTRRERDVLELIARGQSNKRIAFELGISEKTVKTHVGHLLAKLGVSDRTQAALMAVEEGLVSPRT
jgi:DNA-binding NarL/FixJ family response regulator/signal transduction histidine kinase